MRHLLLTTAAAAWIGAALMSAQEPASFTGTWEMDIERSVSAKGGHNPGDDKITQETLVIRETADELIVERQRGSKRDVIAYSFAPAGDRERQAPSEPEAVGTTSSAAAPAASGASGAARPPADGDAPVPTGASGTMAAPEAGKHLGSEVQEARAERKDGKVVTKVVMMINGKAVTTDESLRLSPDGRELIVERQLQVHHGYTSAKAASEGQDIYVRKQQ